jgi:hypothetical protein
LGVRAGAACEVPKPVGLEQRINVILVEVVAPLAVEERAESPCFAVNVSTVEGRVAGAVALGERPYLGMGGKEWNAAAILRFEGRVAIPLV